MRFSQLSFDLPSNSRLTPASNIKPAWSIRQGLAALGHYLQDWLVNSHEPLIKERCDRQGNRYWQVYDPTTQDFRYCESENEVRIWLEQRYYQSHR